MSEWYDILEKLYNKSSDIRREKYRKNVYNFYVKTISEDYVTENYVICPICGLLKSILSQHIRNKHDLNKQLFYEKYPTYKLVAKNFAHRAADNKIMSDKERQSLSNRMKKNNPMKNLSVRKAVSDTRKILYKDPDFKKRMDKIRIKNVENSIHNGTFKIPGWGVSGYYNKIYFRSTNELKALIWFHKNGYFEIESNIKFNLDDDCYFCDFKVGNTYYEIKDKTYPQDDREIKQLRVIKSLKENGFDIRVWNKATPEIKSIAYIDILKEYIDGKISFIESNKKYCLVRRLENEYGFYK